MAKRNRQPEQQHRVYRLPEDLRDRVKRARKKDGQTMTAFIRTAVESQLPGIEQALVNAGITQPVDTRPARLPMDTEILAALKTSSQTTGAPASTLLLACLARSAAPAAAAKKAESARKPATKKAKKSTRTRRAKS